MDETIVEPAKKRGRKSNAQKEAERLAAASSLTETPEFKTALQEEVARAKEEIANEILSKLKTARDGRPIDETAGDDKAFAAGLAMAIAELNDQGAGRKRVSPQIVQQRGEARELMTKLIVEAKVSGQVPVYQLRNKVYLDEQLVEPVWIDPASKQQRPTEIEWRGVPSDAMKPVNDVAKGIFKAFMDSIGSVEREDHDRPLLGVTAGGLVIKSGSASVRPVQVLRPDDPSHAPVAEGGLGVRHKAMGGQYVERRVLGTVAPPARQTA